MRWRLISTVAVHPHGPDTFPSIPCCSSIPPPPAPGWALSDGGHASQACLPTHSCYCFWFYRRRGRGRILLPQFGTHVPSNNQGDPPATTAMDASL